ncbi:hypothetical protein [Alkalilimnicola sp. S0819]|uniref:hypothetical protein n=1 Tax=Alkalilimnicola sp. S0819 TaxID=2613922 RepID=UPI0012623CD6|nr:hypothetical protein [Alkalilimnicola sp. S0819]KAB7619568.1 hypothetical protein F3N43_13345 [Alkalilimnicola sp. S0819]MPQ17620.1 hypothetical protein [Alkalilimnicola sp. S0819]
MVTLLQGLAAGALALVFVFFALGNAWTLIRARSRRQGTSLALFVGGLCGALAVLVAPLAGSARWLWLPLLLDLGTLLPGLALTRRRLLTHSGAGPHRDPTPA